MPSSCYDLNSLAMVNSPLVEIAGLTLCRKCPGVTERQQGRCMALQRGLRRYYPGSILRQIGLHVKSV